MAGQVTRHPWLLMVGLVLAVAGCGTGADPSDPASTDARASVERPYSTPEAAANGFGLWFKADARDCGTPSDFLRGRLPQEWLDHWRCDRVLTSQEVSGRCHRETLVATGVSGRRPEVVSPTRQRRVVAWNSETVCSGGTSNDSGRVSVTVERVGNGWSVTSYDVLTGPGAGTKGTS